MLTLKVNLFFAICRNDRSGLLAARRFASRKRPRSKTGWPPPSGARARVQAFSTSTPYVPGTSALAGAHPVHQALLQRDAVRALSQRRSRPISLCAGNRCRAIPTARRGPCARRSPAVRPRSRRIIVCGTGSDELLNLVASAYLGPGDEAIYTEHGFLVYKIAILGRGATPVVAPGDRPHRADVDAILACVSARNARGVHRQPEQPDRHLSRLRRGAAAARRPCRTTCCSCSTRPTPNMCATQRLRSRHRAGRDHAEHGDDADLLQDLRARQRADRLGLLPDRNRRRAEPHPRAVQCHGPGDRGRHRRARRPALMSSGPSSITKTGCAGMTERSGALGIAR